MRIKFNEELELLNGEIIEMGNLIETAIRMSISALENRDVETAKTIMANDAEVNNMERVIERRCLKLILKHQPMASDLRFISSALKMITDMERIGDQAADIAEIVVAMGERALFKEPVIIKKMSNIVIQMVNMSIDSFVRKDISLVATIINTDLEVNSLFDEVKYELVDFLKAGTGDEEQITDFLMIAKYLERIGDHAKNIAEWVYFALEGEHYKNNNN